MEVVHVLILAAFISSFSAACSGEVLFSKLPRTLTVTTSPSGTVVLKAGATQITVTWGLNQSLTNTDTSRYTTVKVKLCYLPESQKDRPWRKNHLNKDKTCQHVITLKPYSLTNNSFTYTVLRDVPTAAYFIRAYVLDAGETQVADGQTTGSYQHHRNHWQVCVLRHCLSCVLCLLCGVPRLFLLPGEEQGQTGNLMDESLFAVKGNV